MLRHGGGAEWGPMCHYPRTLKDWLRVLAVTKWRENSGAELVEAAVVIPVLLMLLLGIFTFGRAWNTYQTITRAAREGARELVLPSCASCSTPNTTYSASYVESNFVNSVLLSDGLDPTQVFNYKTLYVYLDPSKTSTANEDNCGVQISFEYPYTFSLPFTSVNLSTVDLSTSVQMRMENQPATCDAGMSVP